MRFVLALYHMVHFGIFSLNSSSTVKLIGRRGRDRMVVAFTTTYEISAYHLWCCELESRSGWGVQHYVIKFATGRWFPPGPLVSSTNKTDDHDITEILLIVYCILYTIVLTNVIRNKDIYSKVAVNTIKQTNKNTVKLNLKNFHISDFLFIFDRNVNFCFNVLLNFQHKKIVEQVTCASGYIIIQLKLGLFPFTHDKFNN